MVVVFTRDNKPIDELAQLADKVMEVAILTMSKLAVQPSLHNFEGLQVEIASLKQEIKMLQQAARNQVPHRHSPSPHCYSSSSDTDHSSTLCWYHQKNADHPVLTRKTTRPTTDGDQCFWPSSYVTDRTSGLRFLMDTGAEVSVIPPSASDRSHHKNNLNLQAVNNTSIATYGNKLLTLNIRLRRAFQWVFTIADVKNPHYWCRFPTSLQSTCGCST